VLGRLLRKLCIALRAVAEASAITVTRPAVCNRSQGLQALTESTATTQAQDRFEKGSYGQSIQHSTSMISG
jgi:hypothetical protein